MNLQGEKLSDATRRHYEELIDHIGDDYIEYRWKRNPVSFNHYRHTQRAVEFAFSCIGFKIGRLLEIGSGPGTWTDICLRNTRNITVVDISSEMVKLVRSRFHSAQLEICCGDFLDDSISFSNSFDVIFSARAIEYMDDKEAMVAKSVHHLSPGGYLIIITKNPNWMDKIRVAKDPDKSSKNDIHSDWIPWAAMEYYYRKQQLTDIVSYPVCVGSYYAPLKWTFGIKLCDFIQKRIYRKACNYKVDFLVESYMTIGRKPLT